MAYAITAEVQTELERPALRRHPGRDQQAALPAVSGHRGGPLGRATWAARRAVLASDIQAQATTRTISRHLLE